MKKLILCLLLFTIFACKNDNPEKHSEVIGTTQIGNFEVSANKLESQKTYTIAYNGKADKIDGVVEYITDFQINRADLNFKDKEATLTVPKGAEAIYFSLKEDGVRDFNNGKGHFLPVYVDNTKSKQYNSLVAIHNLKSMYMGIKKDEAAFLETMNDEQKQLKNPSIAFDYHHIMAANQAKDSSRTTLINKFIEKYGDKNLNDEESLNYLIEIYRQNKNQTKVEQLKKQAIAAYPEGDVSKKYYLELFDNSKNSKQQDIILDSIQNIITSKFEDLDYKLQDKAIKAYEDKEKKRFDKLAQQIEDPVEKAKTYNYIAEKEFAKNKLSKNGLAYIETAAALINDEDNILKNKPDYLTVNETKNVVNNYKQQIISNLVNAKAANGELEEAISLQEDLVGDGNDAEANQVLISYLLQNKQYDEVVKKGSKFYKNGHITTQSIKDLEKAMLHTKTPEDTKTLLSILNTQYVGIKSEEIAKNLINEPATDFTFKNLEGKDVSLSDYKGKIVILDFWATWCAPCKASFPGMQKAIDYYSKQDNDDVAFLFIDTMEFRMKNQTEREETVSSYIKEKKYTFNVLYDEVAIEGGTEYTAFKNYKIQSLPTKIFIDKKGLIRYVPKNNTVDTDIIFNDIKLVVETIKNNPV